MRYVLKKTEDALNAKLEKELGIKVTKIERLYHGYWQRNSGAWSWMSYRVVDGKERASIYGSQWPIKTILKAKKLSVDHNDGSIFPED